MKAAMRAGQLIISPNEEPLQDGVVVWEGGRIVSACSLSGYSANVANVAASPLPRKPRPAMKLRAGTRYESLSTMSGVAGRCD